MSIFFIYFPPGFFLLSISPKLNSKSTFAKGNGWIYKEKNHYIIFKNWMVLICKNFIKFIHNWPNGSGERSLNFFDVFSLFLYYLILEIFEHSWMSFTQGCFVPSLVEIVPVGLKKKIFKFCQCIFAISLLSHLWKRPGSFIWIPFTKGCFVTRLVKIDFVVLDKKNFFKFRQCIISPWKRAGPFVWTNFNPLYPRIFCANL